MATRLALPGALVGLSLGILGADGNAPSAALGGIAGAAVLGVTLLLTGRVGVGLACVALGIGLLLGTWRGTALALPSGPDSVAALIGRGEVELAGTVIEREVTLGEATHNTSTISGEALTLFVALLSNKFGNQPATVMEVSVRLQDGSVRTFHEALSSVWHEGDRVKISMGRIKPLS